MEQRKFLDRYPISTLVLIVLAAILTGGLAWELGLETAFSPWISREFGVDTSAPVIFPSLVAAVILLVVIFLFAGFLVGQRAATEKALAEARRRLECIDATPDWMWETDEKGVFTYLSPKIRDVLGYEEKEVLGKTAFDLMAPEEVERVGSKIRDIFRERQSFSFFDNVVLHRDGRPIALEVSGVPVFDDAGRFRGYRGINRDVTDRKAIEKALRESEERYRIAFRTSPDAINLNRLSDGLYVDINDGFTRQTGYTREDVIGRVSTEIGVWANPDDRRKLVDEIGKHGRVVNLDFPFRRKDGVVVAGLMSAHVLDLAGEPHILSVSRDVSELKRAQDAVRESEARLRSLLEAVSIGVGVDDLDGRTITANVGLAEMLGYTADEMLDLRFADYTHPDHIEEDTRLFAELSTGKRTTYQMEKRYRRKDGEIIWGRLTRVLVVDAEGKPAYCLGMVEDISHRKRAEEALRESLDRFAKVFRASPVSMGISRLDDGVIVDVNRAWLSVAGYSWNDTVGRTSGDLEIWADVGRRSAFFDLVARDGMLRDFDAVMISKDGAFKDVEFAAELIEIGGTQHVLWVMEDVTERKRAQDFLYHAQKMEAIGQLTGGVAHDFNNILAVILTNAECLQDEMDPSDDRIQLVEAICGATERGADLTGRLLSFSRRQSLHPQTIDLKHVVEDIAVMLRRTLGESIEIRITIGEGLPKVHVDRGQLENALLNLAINARDAMGERGILALTVGAVEISPRDSPNLSVVPAGRYANISVADTGCGMSQTVAERVFEPFFTTKPHGEGTGLGLSMVYGFVRQSGGFIDVESEIGRGTRFDLLFPVSDQGGSTVSHKAEVSDASRIGITESRLNVLLAEDDPGVRLATRRMLESVGANVTDTDDGDRAIALLDTTTDYDLLVTDVVMPGATSGADLAEAARSRIPGLKVLYISGYARGRLDDSDIDTPNTRFLQKPFKHMDLVEVIGELFGYRA